MNNYCHRPTPVLVIPYISHQAFATASLHYTTLSSITIISTMKGTSTTAIILASTTAAVSSFSVLPTQHARSQTELYGLFDGVKDAFTQPPSSLDSERETPIDRWMGWSVVSENDVKETAEPVGTFHQWVMGLILASLSKQVYPSLIKFHRLTKPFAPPLNFARHLHPRFALVVE